MIPLMDSSSTQASYYCPDPTVYSHDFSSLIKPNMATQGGFFFLFFLKNLLIWISCDTWNL